MTAPRFQDLVARSWNQVAPISSHFELTFRCNLDCSFCYNEKIFGGELTLAEITRVLESLARMSVLNVNFSGGEPLVRKDLRQIIDKAQELGFNVKVYTNAVLIDEDWAKYFSDAGIFGLEVSIHSDEPEGMDKITRVPGSFHMVLAALERLKRHGVYVVLKTPVTRHNIDRLFGIKAIGERFGYPNFFDAKITQRDDGDLTPVLEDAMTPEQQVRYWSELAPRLGIGGANLPRTSDDEAKPICGTASGNVVVDPFGNVLPCVQWRRPLGNVREQSLEAIWWHGAEAQTVRQMALDAVAIADANPNGAFSFYCLAKINQAPDPLKMVETIWREGGVKKAAYEKLTQIAPPANR